VKFDTKQFEIETEITFLQWELKKKWQSVNFLFEFISLQVKIAEIRDRR